MYEKWHELEHQFRAEAKQDAPPFGPGVVEWDYSRYTRALGFGKAPGLDNLRRRACVVASGRYAFRDDAARHLKRWGADIGWDFIRVSARPSTLVPDPVIYQLGIEVTHPDSLIFCAAGQQGAPALGKRPRSEVMRIPLTPSERWLIAADRVRRRLRTEIATRALVIFIDDAEYLTPSALTTLSYLLDAQCAWKSHFLSSPAKVYIAFSLPARHDAWFHETLARFNPLATPFTIREPVGPRTLHEAMQEPNLSVEEEHVAEVLAAAEVALSDEGVTSVLGSTGTAVAASLADKGGASLRSVLDAREWICSTEVEGLDDGGRISKAIREYRRGIAHRAGVGGGYVQSARFLAAFSRGQPHCAWDGLGALDPSAGALVPLFAGREILSIAMMGLNAVPATARPALMVIAGFALSCESSKVLLTRCISGSRRSPKAWIRLVWNIAHLPGAISRRIVDDDTWAHIGSVAPDPTLGDFVAVLGESSARVAELTANDLVARRTAVRSLYAPAVRSLAQFESSAGDVSIQSTVRLLVARIEVAARGKSFSEDEWPSQYIGSEREFVTCPGVAAPGHLRGSAGLLSAALENGTGHDRACAVNLPQVRDELVSPGSPAETIPLMLQLRGRLGRAGISYLMSGVLDEILVVSQADPTRDRRKQLVEAVLASIPVSASRIGVQQLVGRGNDRSASLPSVWDQAALSMSLLGTAGVEAAVSVSRSAVTMLTQGVSPLLIAQWAASAIKTPSGCAAIELRRFAAELRQYPRGDVGRAAALLVDAVDAIHTCEFDRAFQLLSAARSKCGRRTQGERFMLYRVITSLWLSTRILVRRSGNGDGLVEREVTYDWILRLLRRSFGQQRTTPRAVEEPFVIFELLERAAAIAERNFGMAQLRVAAALCNLMQARWGWTQEATVRRACQVAPRFTEQLTQALRAGGCMVMLAGNAAVGLSAALSTARDLWGELGEGAPGARRPRPTSLLGRIRIPDLWGVKRIARVAIAESGCDGALFRWALRYPPGRCGHVEMNGAGIVGGTEDWRVEMRCSVSVRQEQYGVSIRFSLASGASSTRSPIESADCLVFGHAKARGGVSGGDGKLGQAESGGAKAFLGTSGSSDHVRRQIGRAASCEFPVLILGETGTGKELVARLIHQISSRVQGRLVVADCGGVPDSLVERELFGNKRGAFTGATVDRPGLVEEADRGTLFLDEIHTMSPRMQAALLRVLDTGEYRRLGADSPSNATFRLIAAGQVRLFDLMLKGVFRQDLFYRMSTLQILLPPLRDRPEDIVELAQHFAREGGVSLSRDTIPRILAHSWPGNVRELRHAIVGAAASSGTATLTAASIGRWLDARAAPDVSSRQQTNDVRQRMGAVGGDSLVAVHGRGLFSAAEFAATMRVSRRSAQRELSRLVQSGLIERDGAGRATRYRVLATDAANGQ